jgi:hypothetical protein
MRIVILAGLLGLANLGSPTQEQFQTDAVLEKIDPDKGIVQVQAGGQKRILSIAKDAKFLDAQGKDLPDGLRAKELKEGAEVTLTVERSAGSPILKSLRLGRRNGPGTAAQAPPKFDSSKLIPLTDLGEREYQGFKGGLYPDGKNERPASHEAQGMALARQVKPLDETGQASPAGRIVLLTVGMSNTSQDSTSFKEAAQGDSGRPPQVLIVNGAQGGMTAARIQNPEDNASGAKYWSTVDDRLKADGATRAQVQAIWIKEADAGPDQGFPRYAQTLEAELTRIVQLLPARFPNLKLCYLSSRTYGGYAKSRLNPEPYAFESGLSVKWLIEQQLKGDPALNCDPARGPVRAPWLSWGPYLWANGTLPRSDGLIYEERDFGPDGTHPSASGQAKVGKLLLEFFKTDSTAREWFRKK